MAKFTHFVKTFERKFACVKFPAKTALMTPFSHLSVFEITRLTVTGKGSFKQLARIESLCLYSFDCFSSLPPLRASYLY